MVIFAYDFRGVLTLHMIQMGETVNKEYYKMLSAASAEKSLSAHLSFYTKTHDPTKYGMEKLKGYGLDLLNHPPYSPDISPSDYDLFTKLKEPLPGIRYDSLDEL
ncbi:LOW QUALITY PROTEIN: MOS1T-like protein [Mya arenaria]|uniref:MOS1T-like protein n=1 Tax=Mya arenaria TaxID=6604 RepID=A0ABY7DIR9_MYAAR|nr:LOW QUALITY PROTEIN: MOS1T-like protein [Mya arenaria]